MDLGTALDRCAALWAAALGRVTELDTPSSLPDWSVRNLVDHLHGGSLRYQLLIEGHSSDSPQMVATRTADFCRPTLLGRFREGDDALRRAFAAADPAVMVDHRVGPRSAQSLMRLRCFELALHSVDLTRSLPGSPNPTSAPTPGVDPDRPLPDEATHELPDDLAAHLLDLAPTALAGLLEGGFLGTPGTSATSDPGSELLRLTGRRS